MCIDFNDHNDNLANGYESVHGGHGYDLRNKERKIVLKLT